MEIKTKQASLAPPVPEGLDVALPQAATITLPLLVNSKDLKKGDILHA